MLEHENFKCVVCGKVLNSYRKCPMCLKGVCQDCEKNIAGIPLNAVSGAIFDEMFAKTRYVGATHVCSICYAAINNMIDLIYKMVQESAYDFVSSFDKE